MWTIVEHIRIMNGVVELAIFTGILYWFFTSSRVADMLQLVGERVGVWCGGTGAGDEPSTAGALRRLALQQRRRRRDLYTDLDTQRASRASELYRIKETVVVPPPSVVVRPQVGMACSRCAPLSRDSWQDQSHPDPATKAYESSVINVLNIGRQTYANRGVISRYLCDLAQCAHLETFQYPDITRQVTQDEHYRRSIETAIRDELEQSGLSDERSERTRVREAVERRASKILMNISSAMSNAVLKLVAWICHKVIRRVARGGCATRASGVHRLRRAAASGLPLVFVPLHRSHLDYILVTFALYLSGVRPPLVAAGDNMKIPLFGWFLRGCGAFYIRRRIEGSEYHRDPLYKAALRSYIINSLRNKNNLEFFIEGGRTRTGKSQLPKAGILSVIMDSYLDGTIEDALLVPVTLNYDRLVDGNFVREQLGMPKQMETFWSALKGIWRMLNTDHGSIRVDFNQPVSLRELAQSFQKYSYLHHPLVESVNPPNNNLAANLDRKILFNHSNSSLYGEGVSAEHKMMVEAIGRHLVYDAAKATPIMCTDLLAYILLTELRGGGGVGEVCNRMERRAQELVSEGRDLGYSGDTEDVVYRAMSLFGPLLAKDMSVRCVHTVAASLEMSYYANVVVAHYAPCSVVAVALESILHERGTERAVRHSELVEASLQLCEILSEELILCAPCQRIEDLVIETIDALATKEILCSTQVSSGLEEEMWSRRFARTLQDEDDDYERSVPDVTYTVKSDVHAVTERRRLVLGIKPLLEAYSTACTRLVELMESGAGEQKTLVQTTLEDLRARFEQGTLKYGEAISTDAIRNCHRLLKQWGVISISNENRQRVITTLAPYDNTTSLNSVCSNITKFNVDFAILKDV